MLEKLWRFTKKHSYLLMFAMLALGNPFFNNYFLSFAAYLIIFNLGWYIFILTFYLGVLLNNHFPNNMPTPLAWVILLLSIFFGLGSGILAFNFLETNFASDRATIDYLLDDNFR